MHFFPFFSIKKKKSVDLFPVAPGLWCCTWPLSSCGEQGLLFAAGQELLVALAFLAEKHGLQQLHQSLWGTGLVAPWHLESSQTRDQIRVSSIGRQPPNHCTTSEVQEGCTFRSHFSYFSSTTIFFSFAATLKHVQGCLFCFKINVVLSNKKDVFPSLK